MFEIKSNYYNHNIQVHKKIKNSPTDSHKPLIGIQKHEPAKTIAFNTSTDLNNIENKAFTEQPFKELKQTSILQVLSNVENIFIQQKQEQQAFKTEI